MYPADLSPSSQTNWVIVVTWTLVALQTIVLWFLGPSQQLHTDLDLLCRLAAETANPSNLGDPREVSVGDVRTQILLIEHGLHQIRITPFWNIPRILRVFWETREETRVFILKVIEHNEARMERLLAHLDNQGPAKV